MDIESGQIVKIGVRTIQAGANRVKNKMGFRSSIFKDNVGVHSSHGQNRNRSSRVHRKNKMRTLLSSGFHMITKL